MYKRWYDVDPTVSLAVSLMRNANIMTQYKCADLIVQKSKDNGIDLADNILTDAFTYVLDVGMIQTKKLPNLLNTLNHFLKKYKKKLLWI